MQKNIEQAMTLTHLITENSENQLRQYTDAAAVFEAHGRAEKEAQTVRGSMFWRDLRGSRTLIRTSAAGAQHSLGKESEQTRVIFSSFMDRKEQLEQRRKTLAAKLKEMRRLNKVYGVGRTPQVVVSLLQAMDRAGIAEQFQAVGTHALYAYEAACGVRVGTEALATRYVDLLYDTRQHVSFVTTTTRLDASLISVFRKADKTFRVRREQLQTAVNDDVFEIDVIQRVPERRHKQMVVSARGDMALMRTVHPLDFIRAKTALAASVDRDPLKRPKDRLQAQVVQRLWDEYLSHRFGEAETAR